MRARTRALIVQGSHLRNLKGEETTMLGDPEIGGFGLGDPGGKWESLGCLTHLILFSLFTFVLFCFVKWFS